MSENGKRMGCARFGRGVRWALLAILTGLAMGIGGKRGDLPAAPKSLPVLDPIATGAEVAQAPPRGWTHWVVRSIPRPATGEWAALPASAAETATRFRTMIAAEVVGDGRSGSRLARVGLGNAIPVGGREVVVSPGGPPEALATLGVVDRVVLLAAQAKLDRASLASRTPTFALIRTPTVLAVGGEHREVELAYALLVDRRTGTLATLCWPIPVEGEPPPRTVTLLEPDLSFEAPIDVRADRRVGPLVVSWSFALASLPPGLAIEVPGAMAPRLSLDAIGSDGAAELERSLRSLLPGDR